MKNLLKVSLAEFKFAMKPFSPKRRDLTEVLLAFEGGFLSLESGDVKVVMRAEGSWDGRAYFSSVVLRAIATVPPSQNPVVVSYAQNHLLLGGLTIKCEWHEGRKEDDVWVDLCSVIDPSIIDVLAMERSAPRVKATGIAKKVRSAKEKMERKIKAASAQLSDLNISEGEIRTLVEQKIADRIRLENAGTKKPPESRSDEE